MKSGQRSKTIKIAIIIGLFIVVTASLSLAYFTLQTNGNFSDINIRAAQFDLNFINSKYISVINGNLIDNENKFTDANLSLFSVSLIDNSDLNEIDYYINLDEIVISETLYSKYFHYELIKFNVEVDDNIKTEINCLNEEGIYFWESEEEFCYKATDENSENILVSKHFGFCDEKDYLNYDNEACNEFKTSSRLRINTNSIRLSKEEKHFLGVRIWLENDKSANTIENNQNHLMENNFSTKISILARQI